MVIRMMIMINKIKIITDGKKWHYLAVRSLSALLRGIKSSNNGDFYCLNCFGSYRTHNKLKKTWKNMYDYCHVDMPKEDEKILKCNHREKSLKALFIKKEQSRRNNPENSYTERKAKHKCLGYSWSLNLPIWCNKKQI